ncbi:GGDEF domain-containing protein [Kineococcus rubinsiae]|uniref:GGDEF domain-containing protein n=1 Tax=Kineococcus rubinsiae TaxID=2609562 RepID=UPI001430768E|nr:GGDEF domain-containing protein [Kineococcus rubinsiae]NIZ90165.1 GGDEF domain-containing protein [Kineococcus rubinsiae]
MSRWEKVSTRPAPPRERGHAWWVPREPVAGTRVLGVLALGGCVYAILNSVVSPETLGERPHAWLITVVCAALLALVSVLPAVAPRRAPSWAALGLALGATVMVLVLDVYTDDTTFGAQVYLGWPALYAAYHLRRPAAWTVTTACTAADVTLLLAVDGVDMLVRDLPAFVATFGFIPWMLVGARDRQEAMVATLRAEAQQDVLTGLATRRVFDGVLLDELARDVPVAVLLADVDRFKDVNDRHGHGVGDGVLQVVAEQLRAACREQDVVARYGGDELAVVLTDVDAAAVAGVAERFRAAVEGLRVPAGPMGGSVAGGFSPGGEAATLAVTVSVGFAVHRPGRDEGSARDLMVRADAALYAAKRGGRNRVAHDDEPVGRSHQLAQ